MRHFIDALHDIWCAVTRRCPVEVKDDDYIRWMKEEERKANTSTMAIRQRQQNIVEQKYLGVIGHDRPTD